MDEKKQRDLILDSRRRRAERVKEYELNKAVYEDGAEPESDEAATQKDADRSRKAAE